MCIGVDTYVCIHVYVCHCGCIHTNVGVHTYACRGTHTFMTVGIDVWSYMCLLMWMYTYASGLFQDALKSTRAGKQILPLPVTAWGGLHRQLGSKRLVWQEAARSL